MAQQHSIDGEEHWRPVNYTSRPWTECESRYGQTERESNGILTGMCMNRMYTLGTEIEVVTDHKPLLPAYNSPGKPKQLRVDRHRTKLLPFRYSLTYEPGETTPSDYGSRHPPSTQQFTEDERRLWCIEDESDIFVNRVIEDMLPKAITIPMLCTAIDRDPALRQLKEDIVVNKFCRKSLSKYHQIFQDLSCINGIIVKGDRILVPESLQADCIAVAHEAHQGAEKTLRLLRETCWFPKMKELVDKYVESCLPCQASNSHTPPEPLKPNLLPERPWQKLHADFKGPIGSKYYLHAIIDQYSKYAEVDIVTSTDFNKLEPCLNRVMATHGIPEEITTDNGSPYFSDEMGKYAKKMGFKHHSVTPMDPQSNGFAENFVKSLCKLVHTSTVEGKDPRSTLNTFLLQYRSTPHATTEKSPAELLFGRKLKTKLPFIDTKQESQDQQNLRQLHDDKKLRQKQYADHRRRAKTKEVCPGDQVLIKQRKTTTKPPFDPLPYNVTKVKVKLLLSKMTKFVCVTRVTLSSSSQDQQTSPLHGNLNQNLLQQDMKILTLTVTYLLLTLHPTYQYQVQKMLNLK